MIVCSYSEYINKALAFNLNNSARHEDKIDEGIRHEDKFENNSRLGDEKPKSSNNTMREVDVIVRKGQAETVKKAVIAFYDSDTIKWIFLSCWM